MIFNSHTPPIDIPPVPVTDFILEQARQYAAKPALIEAHTGRTLSYQQVLEALERTTAGLAAQGFTKGDVLAIYCTNSPEYTIAFLAVAKLGGISTMVSPLFNETELATQLQDSGARFLLTQADLAETARAAARQTRVEKIFVLGDENVRGMASFASLMTFDGPAPPPVEIDPLEDVVALPYSSGTTGLPKGVMLTHHNLVAVLRQTESFQVLRSEDRTICVIPCYHVYGFHVVMNLGLRTGATVITLPRFELTEFLRALERYQINVVPAVPPIVLALARHPLVDQFNLSKLERVHCGAAPLAIEVADACEDRLGVSINYGYGMTELSPLSHLSSAESHRNQPGAAGYCLPNTECKIVSIESGDELGPGEEGEVCVRGPQVMKGYLNQPQATAEIIDNEGWLYTGDIGYATEEGELFIIDRLKELIKYKGRQVAPAELEAILLSHPAVADAAVIPSPDADAGEVPIAFVVTRNEITSGELLSFVAERVAPHKKVRRVEFIDQIPKSPTGKILRRLLVQRVREHVRG
jgi:acyl-CoA synthetase (AMP-forming)/AMP-acid ligase II